MFTELTESNTCTDHSSSEGSYIKLPDTFHKRINVFTVVELSILNVLLEFKHDFC